MTNNEMIKLTNVRIVYPNIIEPSTYTHPGAEPSKPKYSCTFILDKVANAKDVELINKRIHELLIPLNTTKDKIIQQSGLKNMALKDGDLLDKEEYENAYILKASTYFKPTAFAKDGKTKITDVNAFYSGCFVNAYVSLWAYPKPAAGVAANLIGVQFAKDGESIQGGGVNLDGKFESLESSDNDISDIDIPF